MQASQKFGWRSTDCPRIPGWRRQRRAQELQQGWLSGRWGQAGHLWYKTVPPLSVLFFSYTLLPTGLSPNLALADSDSKIQAEQVCQPRGMEHVSLQLPIPHFTRPLCYWDMFTLPRQAFQWGSFGPRASIPAAPPWNRQLLSQQYCPIWGGPVQGYSHRVSPLCY